MTAISRYKPAVALTRVRNNMDNLINDFFGRNVWVDDRDQGVVSWAPRVDFSETNENYLVVADLPGMKKADVEVSFENGVLTIRGERVEEHKDDKLQYHHIERVRGRFSRSFHLGTMVKVDKIKASFDQGVLKVEVPKAEEVKPMWVQIE